jgi:hypothetical protein
MDGSDREMCHSKPDVRVAPQRVQVGFLLGCEKP